MSSIINGMYPRVSRSYVLLRIAMFIAFLRNVIDRITGSADYPNPSPTMAILTAAVDDLEAKNQASMNGDRVAIAQRNASHAITLNLARQLGNYVESTANGALDVLLSSGFEAIRAPSPSAIPAVPSELFLTQGAKSGELYLRFTGDYNVRNFSVQHSDSATGPWIDDGLYTKTRLTIGGLTSGKVYWVRLCANGATGSSDYSSPISAMTV